MSAAAENGASPFSPDFELRLLSYAYLSLFFILCNKHNIVLRHIFYHDR